MYVCLCVLLGIELRVLHMLGNSHPQECFCTVILKSQDTKWIFRYLEFRVG